MEKSIAVKKTVIGCKKCTGMINWCMVCKKNFKLGDKIICHLLDHEHEECHKIRIQNED